MYLVAKTMAEKAAWEFAKENGLDLVTIQPSLVLGPFITPLMPASIKISLALITSTHNYNPNKCYCRVLLVAHNRITET